MKNQTTKCVECGKGFETPTKIRMLCSHECHLKRRRNWYQEHKDDISRTAKEKYHNGGKEYYAKYEKTERGFLMRKYRNMQSRIVGIQKKKHHLYKGLPLLSREDFYKWAFASRRFKNMYKRWVESGYQRKLTPSVDRIDSSRGYEIDNMRWLTHSENSRLGSISQHRKN